MVPSSDSHADPAPTASGTESVASPRRLSELMHVDPGVLGAPDARPATLHAPVVPVAPAPRRAAWLLGLARAGFKVTLVIGLVWGLAFNLSEVRGSSMLPGIQDRDRVLVDQLTYLVAPVERGDVVVLRYPLDPSLDYIKRVVAVPGDEVRIADGRLWVNGTEVEEPYLDDWRIDRYSSLTTTVRPGHYFVLGDNRARSSDSREFGQVPFAYLRGKVRARLWPMDRVGAIH